MKSTFSMKTAGGKFFVGFSVYGIIAAPKQRIESVRRKKKQSKHIHWHKTDIFLCMRVPSM